MEMSVKEVLVKARNKIEKRQNWCKKAAAKKMAVPNNGNFYRSVSVWLIECGAKNEHACQWCATGAVDSVVEKVFADNTVQAKRLLSEFCPNKSIAEYNDERKTSHKDIIEIFDKSIEFVEADRLD